MSGCPARLWRLLLFPENLSNFRFFVIDQSLSYRSPSIFVCLSVLWSHCAPFEPRVQLPMPKLYLYYTRVHAYSLKRMNVITSLSCVIISMKKKKKTHIEKIVDECIYGTKPLPLCRTLVEAYNWVSISCTIPKLDSRNVRIIVLDIEPFSVLSYTQTVYWRKKKKEKKKRIIMIEIFGG